VVLAVSEDLAVQAASEDLAVQEAWVA